MAALRYWMGLAPVEFTLSVGLAAVLVTVKRTVMRAPVANVKPARVTAFSAVPAAVEHDP